MQLPHRVTPTLVMPLKSLTNFSTVLISVSLTFHKLLHFVLSLRFDNCFNKRISRRINDKLYESNGQKSTPIDRN